MNDHIFTNAHPSLSFLAVLLATVLVATTAFAQDLPTPPTEGPASSSSIQPVPLPNAPKPTYQPPIQAYSGIVLGAFCGSGASTSSVATKPTVGCGVGGDILLLPVFFEFGVMGPQANRSYLTGYMSVDAKIPLRSVNSKYLPVVIGGYSRLFETGHGLDYGIALSLPRRSSPDDWEPHSLQIELRDYWTFASPNQHNVMLRVGWLVGASD